MCSRSQNSQLKMKKHRPGPVNRPTVSAEENQRPRKNPQNSNITAQRVTLSPGFLNRCIQSETVYKSTISSDDLPTSSVGIANNFQLDTAVDNCNNSKLRPSNRQLQKTNSSEIKSQSASNYYLEALPQDNSENATPNTNKRFPQNRSKSVFKEIKNKYEQAVEHQVNDDFGTRIFAKIVPTFKLKDLSYYKNKIFEEVDAINAILTGRINPAPNMSLNSNCKRPASEEDKENFPVKFPHIPPANWVLQTPPNRKLNYNGFYQGSTNSMQPAVVETLGERKVVYEMNPKVKVDLTNFCDKRKVGIDKRYMVEVANVPSSASEASFPLEEHDHFMETSPRNQINLRAPTSYALENYFSSLTCRPKKTVAVRTQRMPLKRKRDIFERSLTCSGIDLESVNEAGSDVSSTFHLSRSEESFTFQFTPSDSQNGTEGQMFDFDGNKKDSFQF